MIDNTLTIFYDGNCPLCSLEMDKLKKHDKGNVIKLVNLHQEDFSTLYPDINIDDAMKILHAKYQNEILLALDVTHKAWSLVGKGIWVAPLQVPIIKQIAHGSYLILAKYRHPISQFLNKHLGIGANNCNKGTCYDKPNNSNSRSK